MMSIRVFCLSVALAALTLSGAFAQEATSPLPAQPNASEPPPPAYGIVWDVDPDLHWIEVVPVFLWWVGEDQPRLQVCTESDVTGAAVKACPIDGAPDTVKSLNLACVDLECEGFVLRERVKVFGKVVDGLFVAGKKEAPEAKKSP